MGKGKDKWPILLIRLGQAVTVGLAYYFVVGIPGLTSSFVAIFVALLPFDLIVAMPSISFGLRHWRQFIRVLLPRITGTAFVLMMGLAFGLAFGLGVRFGFPRPSPACCWLACPTRWRRFAATSPAMWRWWEA